MRKIDFINDCEYTQTDDIKLAVIDKDGKRYDNPFPGKMYDQNILNVHTDYLYLLVNKYFNNDEVLLEQANNGSLYGVIVSFINKGFVFYNNDTTYTYPRFLLHGKSGVFFIPDNVVTNKQLDAVNELKKHIIGFNSLDVHLCETQEGLDINEFDVISSVDTNAIDLYLQEKNAGQVQDERNATKRI